MDEKLDLDSLYNQVDVDLQKKSGKGLGISITVGKPEEGICISEVVSKKFHLQQKLQKVWLHMLFLLIHEAGSDHYFHSECPSVRPSQNLKIKRQSLPALTVGWPSGSLMTPDLSCLFLSLRFYFWNFFFKFTKT